MIKGRLEHNLAWELLRLALAAAVVLVLPGLLVLEVTRVVPKGVGRMALLPLSFSISMAFISLIGLIGYALNVGLVVAESIILGSAALLLLKLVWAHSRVRGNRGTSVVLPPLLLADGAVVVSVALLAALAAWVGIWLSHTADSFYHIAGISTLLADDSMLVERVLYADSPGGLDPISGTWHLALALVSNIGEIDPVFLFDQLPPAMVILLALAFFSFARVLLKNPWWALAATLVQFIVVFQLDFRTSPYPNIISFVVLWTALLVLFKLLESGERKGLLIVGASGFALAGLHLFTFELLILSIVGYGLGVYVVSRCRRQLRGDVASTALAFGLVSIVSLPFVIMKIEGSFLVMASGFADGRDFRDIGLLFDGLDRFPLLSYLGDTVLSPITSLNASEWIADNSFVFVPDRLATPWGLSSYGGPLFFGALAYGAVLLLLPTAFAGRRDHIFLIVTTLTVPMVLLNPAIVSPLTGRVADIPLLRLPNLAPFALVAIAVSAPVFARLWRIGMCRVGLPLLDPLPGGSFFPGGQLAEVEARRACGSRRSCLRASRAFSSRGLWCRYRFRFISRDGGRLHLFIRGSRIRYRGKPRVAVELRGWSVWLPSWGSANGIGGVVGYGNQLLCRRSYGPSRGGGSTNAQFEAS